MHLRYAIVLLLLAGFAGLVGCFSNRGDEGELQYTRHCSSCHLENGEGLRGVIPPLKGSDYIENNRENLACLIRKGMSGPIKVNGVVYNQPMPGNEVLTDADVTNIINYMHREFGSPKQQVPLELVRNKFKECP